MAKQQIARISKSSETCPDVPETSTTFFESEGPLKSLLFLNNLRQDGKLCDALIQVNEKVISAHRLVLASSSSYFAEIYTGDVQFKTDGILKLASEDVDEDLLETLIDFAYTKQVQINGDNVHRLFNAADCLRFGGLKEACFRYLLRTVDTDNCLSMWTFAAGHEGDTGGLIGTAFNMVKKNFKDVVKTALFLEMSIDHLETLISCDDIAVAKEEEVYEVVVLWLEHDEEERIKHIGKLMSLVRLKLMDLNFLMNTVDKNAMVRSDRKALDELMKAIEWKEKTESGQSPQAATPLPAKVDSDDDNEDDGYETVPPRRPSTRVEEIRINKNRDQRLGLSVMGGSDRPGHVFRRGDRPGLLINKIIPGCAAADTGLKVGDRILSVNGHVIDGLTHERAVALLAKSRESITLVVRHEDPPAGLKEFTLKSTRGEGFGFMISGGASSPPAFPEHETDDGIFIMQLLAGGAADMSGFLAPGQRLLQVNSISMLSATHAEAVQAVRQSVDRVTLMVCDGYNQDAYMTPQGVDEAARDKKRQALIHRKSQIFDPSACVSY